MKKLFYIWTILMTLCLICVGCSEGENESIDNSGNNNNNNNNNNNSSITCSISLSKNEMEFDSNAGYQTLIITSSDEWSVSGGADWCDISASSGSTGETIAITVEENPNTDDRSVTFTFSCGNKNAQLTILQYGIIETSYVDLGLGNENTEIDFNEQTGETKISYSNGSIPNVKVGQAFVLNEKYGYNIRRIIGVRTSNGKLHLQTEHGNMCDLFKNINFTLTTNPDMVTSARSIGRVITPTSIKMISGDKCTSLYKRNNVLSRNTYVYTDTKFKFNNDFSNQIIREGDWGKLKFTKGVYDINMDALFFFEFGEKINNQVKSGKLNKFKYYLDGDIDLDIQVDYNRENESYNFEEKEIVKEKVSPSIVFEFKVGIVPVYLTLDTDLGIQTTSYAMTSKTNIQGGFKLNSKTKSGLEYDAKTGITPFNEYTHQLQLQNPYFANPGNGRTKTGIFPHIELKIYKDKGPWFELIPSIIFNTETGIPIYGPTGWNAEISTKTEAVHGMNWESGIFSVDYFDPVNSTLVEDSLYKAPYCIILESPNEEYSMQVNEEVEVCFHVQGKNCINGDLLDCPKATIFYGAISSSETSILEPQQTTADETGRVKIKWGPTDASESLIAQIIDVLGNIIDKAEFKPNIKDERRELLKTFYKQTNGDNWKNNHNWLTDAPIETWYGVSIDEETGKISLNLSGNNLTGSIDLDMTIDSNQAGVNSFQKIYLNNNQIENIRLIGHQSLETLYCSENPLDKVNVSGCINIKKLDFESYDINDSFLNQLNVSNCTSLETLSCKSSKISSLILTGCTSLKVLDCAYTSYLKDISTIQDCKKLASLYIENSQIRNLTLIDFKELEELVIRQSALETLNVTGCSKLKFIDNGLGVSDLPPNIRTMILSGCNSLQSVYMYSGNLTYLDISGCSSLVILSCQLHPLKTLNISGCIALESIFLTQTQLTNLNLSGCKNLKGVNIEYNNYLAEVSFENLSNLKNINCLNNEQLTALNVSGCNQLEKLNCYKNKLINLNVSGLSNLKELTCSSNQLISLDVTGCTKLEKLYCDDNKICSVIPDWFSQIKHYFDFFYDVRFKDYWWEQIYNEQDQWIGRKLHYTDNGIGWWYPGEPDKGYHGRE